MLALIITIATITDIGRVYISVVVGITTAVHIPEGIIYKNSFGILIPRKFM
jgi:hypothetical protein